MFSSIGSRLKELVKETGKEQKEVAVELKMKPPTFNGYVGNKREPSIERLRQFAAYFGVSVDYLTGYTDIRNPYMNHLPENLHSFINDPGNSYYIELAKDIKEKTVVLNEKIKVK